MPARHSPFDPPHSVIAVPATPFTEDNRVDVDSLRRHVRTALDEGATGLLAPAVAGEVQTLSQQERGTIVATLVEEAAGAVPVIGGCTDPDPDNRIRIATRYIETGCEGILAYLPYDGDPNAYAESVRSLATTNPGFLMIQDLDQGREPLPVDLIAALHREIDAFTWIKVETGDRMRKISAIRATCGPSLKIGTAGPDVIEALDRGADAYMPTLYTALYNRIFKHHRAGRRDEAIDAWRKLLPCLLVVATHPEIQWHISKAVLHHAGLFTAPRVRIDCPEPDPAEQQLIKDLLAYIDGMEL